MSAPSIGESEACLHHLGQHVFGALAGECRVPGRGIFGRRLEQARQHGGLGHGQFVRALVEEAAGGGFHAVGAAAEVDAVEIQLENVGLVEAQLQPERQHQLLELARQRALGGEEDVLGELLGDGRAALHEAAGFQVGEYRAAEAGRVDAPMRIEAPVLDGEHGVDQVPRQRPDGDVGCSTAALGQQRAVAGEDADDGCALLLAQRHRVGDRRGVVDEGAREQEASCAGEIDAPQDEKAQIPWQPAQEAALAALGVCAPGDNDGSKSPIG